MPLYEFKCSEGHVEEHLRPYQDRDLPLECECGSEATRIPSCFYTTPESLWTNWLGRRVLKNDSDDPWEGSALEGRGKPNTLTYKSDKLFFDQSQT